MAQALIDAVKDRFSAAVLDSHSQAGDDTIVLQGEALLDVVGFLRNDPATSMEMLVDVTAVDWLGRREPRFEVVYHLYSVSLKHRLRIKVPLSGDDPSVSSLCSIYKGANWPERETYDMFGIRFEGHGDLKRILLYEEFEGHPLRKDYPKRGHQPLMDVPSLAYDPEDQDE
jgi:NADH-quinone oxidoreductase subunit C